MKTFLRKILALSWTNRFLKATIDYSDDKKYLAYVYKKKQGLINHAATIETVAVRGSYADYGFFPQYIENSYNLGLTSSDAYFNYHLYLKLREMLPNLKNMVYYTSGFTSGFSGIRTREKYRLVSYKYFFDIPYQETGYIDEKVERKTFEKCKKSRTNVPESYRGYETKNFFMTGTSAIDRGEKIVRENSREPDQIIWIKKIIEQIIEDRKNIFIVIPPYSTALKGKLPPREELYQKTYVLLNSYRDLPNVQLIDLYDSELFDDSDMGDNDHFNEKGAQKCTLLIKKYIEAQCRR